MEAAAAAAAVAAAAAAAAADAEAAAAAAVWDLRPMNSTSSRDGQKSRWSALVCRKAEHVFGLQLQWGLQL